MNEDNVNYADKSALNKQVSAKVSLDKDLIIDAALVQIARGGITEISFRKLASELRVSPMAIYRYFEDKSALLAETLDEFIYRADVIPCESLAWDDWLRELVLNMYVALKQDVKWIPVFTEVQFLPHGLSVMESSMNKLIKAGFTEQQSVEGFLAVIQSMLGACVLYSTTHRKRPEDRLPQNFQAEKYPSLVQVSGIIWGPDTYNFFKGLDLILEGMHVQLNNNQL